MIAFFSEMYDYLLARPNEWEQKAYQLLVMRFLIGLGDDLQCVTPPDVCPLRADYSLERGAQAAALPTAAHDALHQLGDV